MFSLPTTGEGFGFLFPKGCRLPNRIARAARAVTDIVDTSRTTCSYCQVIWGSSSCIASSELEYLLRDCGVASAQASYDSCCAPREETSAGSRLAMSERLSSRYRDAERRVLDPLQRTVRIIELVSLTRARKRKVQNLARPAALADPANSKESPWTRTELVAYVSTIWASIHWRIWPNPNSFVEIERTMNS